MPRRFPIGFGRFLLALACAAALLTPWSAMAQALVSEPEGTPDHDTLAGCASIENEGERLACYDRLVDRGVQPAPDDEEEAPAAQPGQVRTPVSPLAERWELDREAKRGRFAFRNHRQSYFLPWRHSGAANDFPQSPSHPTPGNALGLSDSEVKFQISFKLKAWEDIGHTGADLWFGYTQQSHWQIYNAANSRPFRETNYEPEAMLVIPTDRRFLGLRWRFFNLAVNHQSNGQSDPLSRSWNRVYAQFGFERGGFALLVRPWWRIKERVGADDNPDITHYMGAGDVVAIYQRGEHMFSLLLRDNFDRHDNRGAAQLDWSFRFTGNLKGYVQLFSGYGESLIDYNYRQNVFGIGVLINNWM